MVMWAILKNVMFQDFWIDFCSILKLVLTRLVGSIFCVSGSLFYIK